MNEIIEKPSEDDCCGSGCSPCVFDVYEQKLKQLNEIKLRVGSSVFSDLKYKPFMLVTTQNITHNLRRYTFQAVNNEDTSVMCNSVVSFKPGDYIIMRGIFKNNNCDEQISRSYTPILNNNNEGKFEVIIQLYRDGKMSSVFRELTQGAITHWRGPYNPLKLKTSKYMVLLGAGTGFVPMYNIAKAIVEEVENETIVKLIGCFRNLESIVLRDELQKLISFWNCNCQFYVSETASQSVRYNEKVKFEKLTGEAFRNVLSQFDLNDLFVVICGPDGFNCTFKDIALNFGLCENENVQIL